jgi:hypothetical protein
MRTNPFYDSWLFLIGSTDDHQKLGALAYVFIILFPLLIVASLWIAWTNWREDETQRSGTNLATWFCRVLVGCMWFQGFLWKLPLPISEGFQFWTGQMVDNAAFEFHRALAKNVYVPYLQVIQPLVFLAELSFATSLILGIGVRLFGVLGTVFALHLWLGLYVHPNEWPWTYVFLAVIMTLFAAHAAGRSLGADALLRRRAAKDGLVGRFVSVAG